MMIVLMKKMRGYALVAGVVVGAMLTLTQMPVAASSATEKPHRMIEQAVHTLLDEFTSRREWFEADKGELFELVERVAVPLFDFKRITKLVLARNWRQASAQQRDEFGTEFKKLLIGTYAIALFQYTGDERIIFTDSEITERKGRKFAVAHSEVAISNAPPIAVDYALILGKDGDWKIYNLTIGGINMITNYRNTYASAIGNLGLDGVIESMKIANAKKL